MGYYQDENRRGPGLILLIVVVLILVLGGGGAALLITQTDILSGGGGGGGENDAEQLTEDDLTPADEPTPAPTTMIVVAARDIPRGTRVQLEDLRVAPYPVTEDLSLPAGAIEVSDESMEGLSQIVGRVARSDIITDQPVYSFLLADADDTVDIADQGSDAALSIPPGRVAMAIPIDRFSGVGYALRSGDTIDIIMSMLIVDIDEDFQTLLPNDQILLAYDPETNTLTTTQYPSGRESIDEDIPFDEATVVEVPSEDRPRPRRGSQLMVDNALVLNVGEYDLVDLYQPIVVTPEPEPEEAEEPADGEGGDGEETVGDVADDGEGDGAAEEEPDLPVIRLPDMVIIAVPRQDALVLNFAIESGISIDVVLRSAFDDDLEDVVSDTVTLDYLLETYGFSEPPRIGVGITGSDDNNPPTEPEPAPDEN
jgi:pilus assembly protein CpaB